MKECKYIAAAILSFGFGVIAQGATLVVPVSADTTLHELFPTSNLGGVGATLGAGAISQSVVFGDTAPARLRTLMRFNLSSIPAGATITAAEVKVTLIKAPFAGPASTFELHRVLKDWGEGTKGGVTGGAGTEGEATWLAPKVGGPDWTEPGAGGGDDASAIVSSSIAMNGLATYTFASTPDMVADVQAWLGNSSSNFGWLMKSEREDLRQTARRFANRESGANFPTLTITYTAPAAELKIQQFELRPAGMFLSWTGGAAPFRVERAESVLGPWTAVTADLTETEATAPADVPSAFYRVVSTGP